MLIALRSVALFIAAAAAEIAGVFLVWRGLREHGGVAPVVVGVFALASYGMLASLQPDRHFGRVLAAYGGVFVAGSLVWAALFDAFKPDRFDLLGSAVCLAGAGLIIWAPR
jgi:small multidrug resistance family-3 protein